MAEFSRIDMIVKFVLVKTGTLEIGYRYFIPYQKLWVPHAERIIHDTMPTVHINYFIRTMLARYRDRTHALVPTLLGRPTLYAMAVCLINHSIFGYEIQCLETKVNTVDVHTVSTLRVVLTRFWYCFILQLISHTDSQDRKQNALVTYHYPV
jgi:hypothetical protein